MAQLAQQARNMQVRHATDTAAAAAAAATSSNSSEPPGPAQHAAGELLQQQLQLLTVDSQEAEQVLLAQLLRACTVTLGLMAAFDLASGSDTLWRSQGAVQGNHTTVPSCKDTQRKDILDVRTLQLERSQVCSDCNGTFQ